MVLAADLPARPSILPEIVEQHAEEASFLWRLRDAVTDEPHYTLRNLAELDGRVDAHIDGLRVADEAGLRIAWAQFDQFGGPGELFAVATLALEDHSGASTERVLAVAEGTPESWRGLFGAIGWVPAETLRGRAVTWLDANTPFRRLLGVVACSLHRVDPRSRLEQFLEDDPLVRVRAIRLAGELGRVDLYDRIRPWLTAEDDGCRFWAAWSAGLLGNRGLAIPILRAFATGDGPFKWRALDLSSRLMDRESAISWLRDLGQDSTHARLLVIAAGVFGDPAVVPWLIEKMGDPTLARVAGESFSSITGVDLSESQLEGVAPDGFVTGPTDEPDDENTAMDPDENLAWPVPTRVLAWWKREERRFHSGVRYLGGEPVSLESCNKLLRDGYQRRRRAAAFELALISGGHLRNWRARSG